MKRTDSIVYGLLVAATAGIAVWQAVEHRRVHSAARAGFVDRARDITTTLGLVLRSQRFFGMIRQDRLESALNELVQIGELKSILLLNNAGSIVVSAGEFPDPGITNDVHVGERWTGRTVTLVNLVDLGTNVVEQGQGPQPLIVMPRRDPASTTNSEARGPAGARRRPRERSSTNAPSALEPSGTNAPATAASEPDAPPRPPPPRRPGRPPWMSEEEYRSLIAKQGLHSIVLVMSTAGLDETDRADLWLRSVIGVLGGVAAAGLGLAWRNVQKSSELQLRLVRASELNKHLREMNLAAAGLAHETRNPLNIIRGHAQILSRQPDAPPEIRAKTREITDEVDRVTAQLNEFINYSKPREIRWQQVPLGSAIAEVTRALQSDCEDKSVSIEVDEVGLTIQADEQQFRQLLFNLILNAIQAVAPGGRVWVVTLRTGADTAMLEVRDDGPGVPPDQREEIFKPYFTTHQKGTGLGLAVVQQIVLAHGWEIHCLANEPRGANFRLLHIKTSAPR